MTGRAVIKRLAVKQWEIFQTFQSTCLFLVMITNAFKRPTVTLFSTAC